MREMSINSNAYGVKKKDKSNQSVKLNTTVLATMLFIIWTLVLIRDVLGINMTVYIFTGIIAVAALISNKQTFIGIAVCIIPLSGALNFGTVYGILSILYVFKFVKTFNIKAPSIILILIIMFELLHARITPFALSTYIAYLCVYLFIAIVFIDSDKSWADFGLLKMFIFSVIVTSMLIIILEIIVRGVSISDIISSAWRIGSVDTETEEVGYYLYNNSNNIALQVSLAITSLLALFQTKRIGNGSFFVILGMLVFLGILTISRTFIITIVAIVMWVVFSSNRQIRSKNREIIFFTIIAGIALVIVFPEVIQNLVERFVGDKAGNISSPSSRTSILNYYLNYMSEDFYRMVYGIGMQSQNIKAGYRYVAHNMILDVYVSWGITGLILATLFLISLFRRYATSMKNRWSYCAFIALLVFTQSGRLFKTLNVMAMLLIVVSILILGARNEENPIKSIKEEGYLKNNTGNPKVNSI